MGPNPNYQTHYFQRGRTMLTPNNNFKIVENDRGFSLIEIMVSVSLMGSLAYFGIMQTFDIVTDMKSQTDRTQVATDVRMNISKAIADPSFMTSQADLETCMQNTNREDRQACYRDATLVNPQLAERKRELKAKGELQKAKEIEANLAGGDGSPVELYDGKIQGRMIVEEYCDWNGTNTICAEGEDAKYAQVTLSYYAKSKELYDVKLFTLTTVVTNNQRAFEFNTTNNTCNNGYVTGLNNDLGANCGNTGTLARSLSPALMEGPRGAPGGRGELGDRGPRGAAVYCNVRRCGVALTADQDRALNRLQGPARIISGNSSTVHVINKHGSRYSMSNSSITSWASRGGGCFEEGTTITMADGSKRSIENIKKGDLVWNPLTKMPALVKKGVKGPEEFIMYSFKVNGEEVKVTKTHPMLTDRGSLKAEDVKANDRMLWKSGELEIESITTYKTENDVYNLFLVSEDGKDIEGAVIANGVITGDLDMQQQLQNKGSNNAKLSH